MNNQYRECCLALLSVQSDRVKAFNINKRLFLIHMLLAVFIAIIFIYVVIRDPDYIETYGNSKLSFIIGMSALLSGSLFFSCLLMWLPAALFAKIIKPQIFLCDNWLIYMSCSQVLNYSSKQLFWVC